MYFLLHMGYTPPMTQFNVGDKVRRLTPGIGKMQPGTEWVVDSVEDANYIGVRGLQESGYMSSEFELVEPAEIEQATTILDKTTPELRDVFSNAAAEQVGWWDVDAGDFVKVRRKVVGA